MRSTGSNWHLGKRVVLSQQASHVLEVVVVILLHLAFSSFAGFSSLAVPGLAVPGLAVPSLAVPDVICGSWFCGSWFCGSWFCVARHYGWQQPGPVRLETDDSAAQTEKT